MNKLTRDIERGTRQLDQALTLLGGHSIVEVQ